MFTPSGEWVIIFKHKVITGYLKSMGFRVLLCLLVAGFLPMLAIKQGIMRTYTTRAVAVRIT